LRVRILAPTKEDGMSSISYPEELEAADLAMIRDVLRAGGFRGVDAEESSDAKRAASALLQSEFRNGTRTREALLLVLQSNREDLHKGLPVTTAVKSEAMARWRDEGGQ
jgi:hypothetical protein